MADFVQLARQENNRQQLYVVATNENVASIMEYLPYLIRLSSNDSKQERREKIFSKLCKGNSYEIRERILKTHMPNEIFYDFFVFPHLIDTGSFERAINSEERRQKELGLEFF